jgi:peptidoglycan DL-endopeptidase CwlO
MRGRSVAIAFAAIMACSVLAPSAGDAATSAPAARSGLDARSFDIDAHKTIAQLEARAARLSTQYRGQLQTLSGVVADAKAATARSRWLHGQLERSRRQVARLAVTSYVSGGPNQALLALFGGHPQGILGRTAIINYLTAQRHARQRILLHAMRASDRADHTTSAKIAALRRMIAALEHQRRTVERLLAKFHPQSPVIGDNITPRMRQVKDAVDLRFGPFPAIGCYRPEATGEHPLGRACDFMLSSGGVMPAASWIQRGYAIAQWAQAHAAQLGIMYIIYRQHIWDIRIASEGWVLMPDRGGITANHYDHVHISVF